MAAAASAAAASANVERQHAASVASATPSRTTPSTSKRGNGTANSSTLLLRSRAGGRRSDTGYNPKSSKADPQPPDGVSFPKVLTQLETDYIQIKKTDKLLHEQLGQWFEHMEEWMHYQKHMFCQIHERCLQLGLQESDPKLPNAAAMKPAPPEDAAPPPPLFPHESARPMLQFSSVNEAPENLFTVNVITQGVSSHPAKDQEDNPSLGGAVVTPGSQPAGVDSAEGVFADVNKELNRDRLKLSLPCAEPNALALLEDETFELEDDEDKKEPHVGRVVSENPDLSQVLKSTSLPRTKAASSYNPRDSIDECELTIPITELRTSGSGSGDRSSSIPYGSMTTGNNNKRLAIGRVSDLADWENADLAEAPWEELPLEMRMWCELVDAVLYCAEKKKLYELRKSWVMSDVFMQRVMRNNENLDLRILTGSRGTHKGSSLALSRHSLTNHEKTNHVTAVVDGAAALVERANDARRCKEGICILDPQSPQRLFWMSIGMVLMVYDLIVLPMQAFELEDTPFLIGVQWFGQIFWTCDIMVTFFTGVYVNSELRTDLRTITRVYASTWLSFDLAVVLPLWIVEFVGSEDDGASNASALKLFRMTRFLRLARMAKFEHYLQEALATVNSSSLILLVGIAKLMTAMIILSHLNACTWFWVGNSADGGWATVYRNDTTTYKYLTAMHWAFTQFQGTSEVLPGMGGRKHLGERLYAVIVVMCSLIILASFVSTLTNMMMQLQALHAEKLGMARRVRAYLSDNEISKQLSVRVKKYIDWKQKMQRKDGNSSSILSMLPLQLQMDLQEEVRGPLINPHKFFNAIQSAHSRTFRQICHEVLKVVTPAPGEMIFTQQDECTQMFFVVSGEPKYVPTRSLSAARHQSASKKSLFYGELTLTEATTTNGPPESNTPPSDMDLIENVYHMGKGDYICEPILWTNWEYCGVLAGTEEATSFIAMPAEPFASVVSGHPPAAVSAVFYARRFVAGLNRFGKSYHDIIDISMMAEQEMEDD